MTPLPEAIASRVHREFRPEDREQALRRVDNVDTSAWRISRERVLHAVLEVAAGDLAALDGAVRLANTDWRDVLVAAGDA